IASVKDALLGPGGAAWACRYRDALSSEAIAGIAKAMTGGELSSVACALFNPLDPAGISIGSPQHFGSRIQPNSPGDDEQELLFPIPEGLSFGGGHGPI